MSDSDDRTREATGVTRRTLVRAGAHAAWVVPAITVINAAPASAATSGTSSGVLYLSGVAASWPSGSSGHLDAGGTVTAKGSGTVNFDLTISFPSALGSVSAATAPTGWTLTSSHTAAPASFTYSGSLVGTSTGAALTFPTSSQFVASNTIKPSTISFAVTTATTGWTVNTTAPNQSPQTAAAN